MSNKQIATKIARDDYSVMEKIEDAFSLYTGEFSSFLPFLLFLAIPMNVLGALSNNFIIAFASSILGTVPGIAYILIVNNAVSAEKPAPEHEPNVSNLFAFLIPAVLASILAVLFVMVGLVILIIPGIIVIVHLAFFTHAIVLRGQGITDALSYSWDVVTGNGWRVFGNILVAGLVTLIPEMITTTVAQSLDMPMLEGFVTPFFALFTSIFMTLLFLDLNYVAPVEPASSEKAPVFEADDFNWDTVVDSKES